MKTHIFLIGMMGCGKSTVGRGLSKTLGCPFLDLDDEIVIREKQDIPAIFASVGDEGFRLCETAALKDACAHEPMVIATGGGIITREENIRLMRQNGLVVWLNRPLEDMIADVRQDTRPNLAGDKEERMRTLFAAREALYRRAAHFEFDNHLPASESIRLLAHSQSVLSLIH